MRPPRSPGIQLPALSVEQLRSIDRLAVEQFQMPSICLMENAGCAAAHHIASILAAPDCSARQTNASIAILCGKGNNGGDGLVIARFLQLLGHSPEILLLADPTVLRGDAATNWHIARAADIPTRMIPDAWTDDGTEVLRNSQMIVDAMLGTGSHGDPRGAVAQAITHANAAGGVRVAIDTPSGLDCDSGRPGSPCFRADHTCTFVATKTGFANQAAASYLGEVKVLSIGAPAKLIARFRSPVTGEIPPPGSQRQSLRE